MAELSSAHSERVQAVSWRPLLEGVLAGLLTGIVAVCSPATFVAMALVGLTLWGIWRVQPREEREWLMWAFGIAWGVRVVLSAGLHLWHGWTVPYGPLALEADSGGYLGAGWFLSEAWHGHYESLKQAMMIHWHVFHGIHPFIYVMAGVFYVFGFSPVAVTFVNTWIALMGLLVLYGFTRRVTTLQATRVAFVLAAASPSWLFFSITHMKEPLLFLGVSLWIWAGWRWLETFRPRYLVGLMLAGWIVWACREWMLAIYVTIGCVFTLGVWLARRRPPVRRRVSAAVVTLLVAGVALAHRPVAAKVHSALLTMAGQATAFHYTGGSSYYLYDLQLSDAQNIQPGPFSRALFRGWRQVIWTYWPPWRTTSSLQRLVLPEVLLIDAVLPLAVIGWSLLLWFQRSLAGWWMAAIAGSFLMVLALSGGNVGTLFRHKQLFLPIYALAVAMGWTWVWSRLSAARGSTT